MSTPLPGGDRSIQPETAPLSCRAQRDIPTRIQPSLDFIEERSAETAATTNCPFVMSGVSAPQLPLCHVERSETSLPAYNRLLMSSRNEAETIPHHNG